MYFILKRRCRSAERLAPPITLKTRVDKDAMNETLTIAELERRMQKTLSATEKAVIRYPQVYRELKILVEEIVTKTLDISDYPLIAEKLGKLLKTMEGNAPKNIFYYFCDRVSPSSISKLKLLRLECWDLLEQLKAFDAWRMETRHLRILK